MDQVCARPIHSFSCDKGFHTTFAFEPRVPLFACACRDCVIHHTCKPWFYLSKIFLVEIYLAVHHGLELILAGTWYRWASC
jgi:hypothetical protein